MSIFSKTKLSIMILFDEQPPRLPQSTYYPEDDEDDPKTADLRWGEEDFRHPGIRVVSSLDDPFADEYPHDSDCGCSVCEEQVLEAMGVEDLESCDCFTCQSGQDLVFLPSFGVSQATPEHIKINNLSNR